MCGVVGYVSWKNNDAVENAVNLILRLQHRGQDAAGLSVLSSEDKGLKSLKGLGLIQNALKDWAKMDRASMAIAHTRYATTGKGGVAEVQPFVKGSPRLALAHNGNVVNVAELSEKIKLDTDVQSDLDFLMQALLQNWDQGLDAAIQYVFDHFRGSYAVVGLEESGSLFAFRDPWGIRPLYFAHNEERTMIASETSAFAQYPKTEVQELAPGEWVSVKDGELIRGQNKNKIERKSFCMFESVYFASPQSEFQNASVYSQRFRLGRQLAKEIEDGIGEDSMPSDIFDYVVPVPETSRTAAIAVAEKLAVPYREFLVKNAYVPRTFILSSQDARLKALNTKLSLIGPHIKDKRILLVDDSVVRGNTSRLMTERLKEAGAKSVSLASTCPPIRHGCFYGIDFPDQEELIAVDRNLDEISKELQVDHLFYISIEGLKKALKSTELCTACLDGKYPTGKDDCESFLSLRRAQRGGSA